MLHRHPFLSVVTGAYLVFVAWSAGLLVIGIRSVHGWTWLRAALVAAPVVALPIVLSVL